MIEIDICRNATRGPWCTVTDKSGQHFDKIGNLAGYPKEYPYISLRPALAGMSAHIAYLCCQ